MKIFKKLKVSEAEFARLREELDDYIWVAIDARKGMISAGDEYLADLRDVLLQKRSHLEDIYGIGVNLKTGEIDYITTINRRNPSVGAKGEVPLERKERIETLMRYFLEDVPGYKIERRAPRYTKKPTSFCSS